VDSTQLAAVLAATVVVASMLSVELGFSVALIELGPTPLSDRSASSVGGSLSG